jgi:hypothetical protein
VKYNDIATIARKHAPVTQRIAWHGALSAPGKTTPIRRHRIESAARNVFVFALIVAISLLMSYEGVLR